MGWSSSIKHSFICRSQWNFDYEVLHKMLTNTWERQDKDRIRYRIESRKQKYAALMDNSKYKWVYAERSLALWCGYRIYPNHIEIRIYQNDDDDRALASIHRNGRLYIDPNCALGHRDVIERAFGLSFAYAGGAAYFVDSDNKFYRIGFRRRGDSRDDSLVRFELKEKQYKLVYPNIQEYAWKLNKEAAKEAKNKCKSLIAYVKAMDNIGAYEGIKKDTLGSIESGKELSKKADIFKKLTVDTYKDELKKLAMSEDATDSLKVLREFLWMYNARYHYGFWIQSSYRSNPLLGSHVRQFIPKFTKIEDLVLYLFDCYEVIHQPVGKPIRDKFVRVQKRSDFE